MSYLWEKIALQRGESLRPCQGVRIPPGFNYSEVFWISLWEGEEWSEGAGVTWRDEVTAHFIVVQFISIINGSQLLPFGFRFDPKVSVWLKSVSYVFPLSDLLFLNLIPFAAKLKWLVLLSFYLCVCISHLWNWMESEHILSHSRQMLRGQNPTQKWGFNIFPSIWLLQWPSVAVVH